jgi:hypothetical protein
MRSAGYATNGVQDLFYLGAGGWCWIYLLFSSSSQYFPITYYQINFLSQHVPQDPNVFPRAAAFLQYALPSCLLGSYIGNLILKVICFYVEATCYYCT